MRRTLDAFIAALGSLAEHKLRTTLTMLGMMFGVGAVVAMLSIGAGAEREALALIERLGTRNVVVRAKTYKPQELEEIRKKSLGLSMRDVDAVQEAVPGVEYAAPRIEVEQRFPEPTADAEAVERLLFARLEREPPPAAVQRLDLELRGTTPASKIRWPP